MRRSRTLRLLPLGVLAGAIAGCADMPLRPRSLDCTLAVLLASGAGCQPLARASDALDAEAKQFAPAAGRARIYVLRPSLVGGRYLWDIQLDGRHAGFIAEHSYLMLDVEPGVHQVSVLTDENRDAIAVDASPGTNRFVAVVPRMGWAASRAELRELQAEEGRNAVRNAQRVPSF